MRIIVLIVSAFIFCLQGKAQHPFDHQEYCLVWSDEFDVDGAPNPNNWRYETGYVRNNEAQYYTNNRRENARVENGHLIIEARRDGWEGHQYTSASLVSWGKVVHRYGRFEVRAKIDARPGSWPAFWTLGERGEWPSNGEIDIMEYYNGKIHANVAWGTNTRWSARWDAHNRNVSEFGPGWADEFHIWRMEWTPDHIYLYVDDVLMNTTDLSQTINGNISDIRNPFHQPHYLILNQAIGGNSGGDPSNTAFPVRFIVDYVRIYQRGNCKLDCNWDEGGSAYFDACERCVGGKTRRNACNVSCSGNMLTDDGFESGNLEAWGGWGNRSISTQAYAGNFGVQIGDGAIERVVEVQPYTTYTIRARVRKSGAGWVRLGVKEHGNLETYKQSNSTSWAEVVHAFSTGNATTAKIYLYNGAGGSTYGDDLYLELAGCAPCSGNLISNGGFEAGMGDWTGWGTRSVTTTNAFEGNASVQVGNGAAEQVLRVEPNTTYRLSAKGRKTGGGWVRLGVKEHGAGELYTSATSSNWTDMELVFTTGNVTSARIYFYNGSGGTAFGDAFILEPARCDLITSTTLKQIDTRLDLYPNPSNNTFRLSTSETGALQIFDAQGRSVESIQVNDQMQYGQHLKPGIYLVRFTTEHDTKTISWVKF